MTPLIAHGNGPLRLTTMECSEMVRHGPVTNGPLRQRVIGLANATAFSRCMHKIVAIQEIEIDLHMVGIGIDPENVIVIMYRFIHKNAETQGKETGRFNNGLVHRAEIDHENEIDMACQCTSKIVEIHGK